MMVTWLWLNPPLEALVVLAFSCITMWLIIRHPDTEPSASWRGGAGSRDRSRRPGPAPYGLRGLLAGPARQPSRPLARDSGVGLGSPGAPSGQLPLSTICLGSGGRLADGPTGLTAGRQWPALSVRTEPGQSCPDQASDRRPSFLPCPECELPARIADRFVLRSTEGPVDHVALECVAGHHFRMARDRLPAGTAEQLRAQQSRTGAGLASLLP
jgi:hypothetical protein